jgi:hypothetical protein
MFMRPFAASNNAAAPVEILAADVEYYLALDPRQLPSRYLYDALGSVLFEAICELPWYGITRAEFGLLETHGASILAQASSPTRLSRIVELGPGNGTKLRTLLEADADGLSNDRPYLHGERRRRGREIHLIDVSGKALDQAVKALSPFERVKVVRHEATYEDGLREIAEGPADAGSTLVLFLGSNIGNFDRPGAEEFLRTIRSERISRSPRRTCSSPTTIRSVSRRRSTAICSSASTASLAATSTWTNSVTGRCGTQRTHGSRCIWSAGDASACRFRLHTLTSRSAKATRSGPRALTNMIQRSSPPC